MGNGLSITGNDDCNKYYPDLNMMSIYDTDAVRDDDGLIGPAGMMVFPPENIDPDSYTTVYSNVYDITDKSDEVIYDWLASETSYENSCDRIWRGWQAIMLRFGPLELEVGDTLHYMVGQIFGEGEEGAVFTGDVTHIESRPLVDPEAVGEITMEELEKELIQQTLARFNHNRRRTAQALGIAERTLYRKIQAYGLEKK